MVLNRSFFAIFVLVFLVAFSRAQQPRTNKFSDAVVQQVHSTPTRVTRQHQELPQQQFPQQGVHVQHPLQLHPLLKQANTVSVGILFMLLIWRNLGVYEMADQFASLRMRALTLPPMIAILLLNLGGFLLNAMRPQGFKNQLKGVLAANTLREWVELTFNVAMVLSRSRYSSIPRDVYIGRFFMNIWWITFCVSFSKSRWVATVPPTSHAHAASDNAGPRRPQRGATGSGEW